ncbi:MAG: hypothetical protein ACRDA7_01220 [Metamycoplasmataceae bacterium]
MNKKLLISLSSLATIAIVAPVLVITSCSGETPATVNLTITAKTDPKLTEANITALEGSELPAQLTALQKLFDGKDLSSANQDKFTVSIDKDKKTVTLTPKSGYTIDGKNTLTSNPYTLDTNPTITDLKITAKTAPEITQEDVTTLEGNDLPTQLIVLNKLFSGDGLTSDNQNNFKVSVDKTKEIVTLTANSDFTINGEKTLNSNKYKILPTVEAENLIITAIANVVLTNAEVTILEGTDANAKWTIYAKLFGGKDFLSENIGNKFNVTFSKSDLEVTLTATIGFTIGGNPSLSNKFTVEGSVMPTDLAISAISGTPTITETELDNLTGTDNNNKLTALQKLFTGNGLTIENFGNFDVSIDKQAKIVTLNAKANYTISGAASLNSSVYTLDTTPPVDKNLIITPQNDPKLTKEDIAALTATDNTAKLEALKKLFTGNDLTIENINGFDISLDTTNRIVTLTAKTGFTINSSDKVASNAYTEETPPNTNLVITKKADPTLTATDVTVLQGNDLSAKFPVLEKLFEGEGLILANQDKFTVSVDINKKTVTLTANTGYTINNAGTLESNAYTIQVTIISLDITAIPAAASLTETEVANLEGSNADNKLAALKKLFTGNDLTIAHLANFDVTVDKSTTIVTLTAKSGFTIGGQASLKSTAYTLIINLNISKRSGTLILEQTDITTLQGANNNDKLVALQKLFHGSDLTLANLSKFNTAVNTGNRIVTLTPITNHTISGGNTLASNAYNINLHISVRSGTVSLIPNQILDLDWDDNTKKLDTLNKIFQGSDLTTANLDKFTIEVNGQGANADVVLRVKTGYIFSNKTTLTKFCEINGKVNANITPINGAASLSVNEENILKQPTTSFNISNQINVLRKLFNGLADTNQRFFKISIDTTPGARKVKLIAKPGYVFGTNTSSVTQMIEKPYN